MSIKKLFQGGILNQMTSHEYAKRLHEIADYLLSRPEFKAANKPCLLQSFYDKEEFLAAVKALGSGKKGTKYEDTNFADITFTPNALPELEVYIPKNKMCTLIRPAQPAQYECEPFLSQMEEESIGQ